MLQKLESTGEIASNVTAFDITSDSVDLSLNFATAGTDVNFTVDISGLSDQLKEPQGIDLTTVSEDNKTSQTAIGFTNILTAKAARSALDTAQNRIEDISALQGEFGATEARLHIASEQLLTKRENFHAAASQIKDADVTEELANIAKNQILQQSASAVLAQANQQPALALSLL